MRWRWPHLVLLGLVGVCLVVVGAALLLQTRQATAQRPAAMSMNGREVMLDPGIAPIPARLSHAVADTGARLTIPAVRLDVPLGALDEVDGQITPPGFTSAYRVRNMGVPLQESGKGTVYVVMHSLRGGAIGPGNFVIDVATGKATVHPGETVRVGRVSYTITGSKTVPKDRLARDRALWNGTPGRLVLITCLQRPGGGLSSDNMVILARRG